MEGEVCVTAGLRFRNGGPFPLTVLNIRVSIQAELLLVAFVTLGFCKKGPRAVYDPKGVRESISSWNFSVRRLVYRLGLWQRGNKKCADLRSARHFTGMYTHTMNARDYDALFYQIYRTTYSKINDH